MIQAIPPIFQNTSTLPPIVQYIVQRRWIYHALFWLLYLSVSFVTDFDVWDLNSPEHQMLFADLAIIMLGAYIQSLFLITKYLYEKRFLWFIVGSTLIYLLQSTLNFKAITHLLPSEILNSIHFFTGTAIFVFYLFFTPSVKIIKDLLVIQQQQQAIEKENMKGDLQFLKGQLSPHLMFNTLNNLYGLALIKSDLLPALMLRLSDVMRYSLYETNQTYVSLNQEITYLKNYIELEKLRVGNDVKITIDFPENIDLKVQIAPMLLIVFIENAFKHSRHAPKEHRYINMKLTLDKTAICFHIENSFTEKNAYFQMSNETSSGIGLELTKRRLDLLYEKNYTLNTDNQNNIFKINLKLDI